VYVRAIHVYRNTRETSTKSIPRTERTIRQQYGEPRDVLILYSLFPSYILVFNNRPFDIFDDCF